MTHLLAHANFQEDASEFEELNASPVPWSDPTFGEHANPRRSPNPTFDLAGHISTDFADAVSRSADLVQVEFKRADCSVVALAEFID